LANSPHQTLEFRKKYYDWQRGLLEEGTVETIHPVAGIGACLTGRSPHFSPERFEKELETLKKNVPGLISRVTVPNILFRSTAADLLDLAATYPDTELGQKAQERLERVEERARREIASDLDRSDLTEELAEGESAIAKTSISQDLEEDELEAIREQIRADGFRGGHFAEAFAKRFGKRAVPVLLEMLKTESNPTAKRKCCLYLGMIGDTRAVKPIIDYLQSELPAEFTRKHRGEILNAAYGLAFLDSDEARAFVELLMTDEYWLGRKDLPVKGKWRLDSYENRKSIRHHCVMFYAMNLWFCQSKRLQNTWRKCRQTY
jgi:hypothetical protein